MENLKNACALIRQQRRVKKDPIILITTKMESGHIIAPVLVIRTRDFSMSNQFSSLPWHDAELLSLNIDRADPGNSDAVTIKVKWPDGNQNDVTFNDCYFLDAKMNFGVIAEESILDATCFQESQTITDIKEKWQPLGVVLDTISCYRITTNSTNSQIDIYALSFVLA